MDPEIMKTIIDIIQENGKMIKEMELGSKNLKTNQGSMLEILLKINTMVEES